MGRRRRSITVPRRHSHPLRRPAGQREAGSELPCGGISAPGIGSCSKLPQVYYWFARASRAWRAKLGRASSRSQRRGTASCSRRMARRGGVNSYGRARGDVRHPVSTAQESRWISISRPDAFDQPRPRPAIVRFLRLTRVSRSPRQVAALSDRLVRGSTGRSSGVADRVGRLGKPWSANHRPGQAFVIQPVW